MRYRIPTLALAAAALAGSTAAFTGAAGATAPWCTTSRIQASVTAGEQLGSNLRTANITLRNVSAQTCRTQGYPGVDLAVWGRPGQHAVRNGATGHPIELAPGQSATATLTYKFGATDWIANELIVTPPDNTRPLRLYWDWRKLGSVTFDQPGAVTIGPLRA
ncbi:DUF4232 domain-containing protein [Nocardia sp. NPDC059764]|uniref:DUF4232 domain-containing protein n=1 Tax=Nocardia sp. NPDC059764 TaxID=3346939 RepID=UPI00365DCD07